MAAKKLKLTHPGKILREEFMEPVGLSAYALAKALVVPLPRVNDIVREKRAISPEMAVLLSAYFGTTDGYWINLQAHYDLEMARERVGKHAARIIPHRTTRTAPAAGLSISELGCQANATRSQHYAIQPLAQQDGLSQHRNRVLALVRRHVKLPQFEQRRFALPRHVPVLFLDRLDLEQEVSHNGVVRVGGEVVVSLSKGRRDS
jgi:addiction module HigA family antidote